MSVYRRNQKGNQSMDQEIAKLRVDIDRLKRRIVLLEDAIKKLHALTDPPEVQRIRAMEERR